MLYAGEERRRTTPASDRERYHQAQVRDEGEGMVGDDASGKITMGPKALVALILGVLAAGAAGGGYTGAGYAKPSVSGQNEIARLAVVESQMAEVQRRLGAIEDAGQDTKTAAEATERMMRVLLAQRGIRVDEAGR